MKTKYEEFLEFHQSHPDVYDTFVRLATDLKARGFDGYGIKSLIERVRWHYTVERGDRDFKLNNNTAPYYARLIMQQVAELDGFFQLREAAADREMVSQ